MSKVVRASKYRHVFGKAFKKELCYDNIRISRSAWDSNLATCNPSFFAVILEAGGGGSFAVIPVTQYGKVESNAPKICGHKGAVLDLAFAPYNDNVIASASEDGHVKVWQIPDGGLKENMTDCVVDLIGHTRKVGHVVWHPTASSVLFSSSLDLTIRSWNVDKGEQISVLECHTDTIFCMSFNWNGSLLATTSKDKKVRIFDSHTGALKQTCDGHQGSKASRVIFLGDTTRLLTTGFSKMSERQYALYDIQDGGAAISVTHQENIDTSSGVLMPFYDRDTRMLYLAGKGDGNIRYYEHIDEKPYICFLSEYKSSSPQRGFGFLAKRGCDVSECEVARFFKLHSSGLCEPVSMVVPRKSDVFQEDIFPDTIGDQAAMTADEFFSGKNAAPILVSLREGFKPTGKVEWKPPPLREKKKDVTECPETEKDYRDAFHILKAEVKRLADENAQKDVQIRKLEQELKSFK